MPNTDDATLRHPKMADWDCPANYRVWGRVPGTFSKQRKYPMLYNTSVYLFLLSGDYISRLAQDITIIP